jgi:hypothetical protein
VQFFFQTLYAPGPPPPPPAHTHTHTHTHIHTHTLTHSLTLTLVPVPTNRCANTRPTRCISFRAFSRFIIEGIGEFALAAVPRPAGELKHVVPCDAAGEALLRDGCAEALRNGTEWYARTVAQSHASDLVAAAASAEHTAVLVVRDPATEASYRKRFEAAGWALLSVVEAVSSKHVTAVIVDSEGAEDKRLRRFECDVSNRVDPPLKSVLPDVAVQLAPPLRRGGGPMAESGAAAPTELELVCVVVLNGDTAAAQVAVLNHGTITLSSERVQDDDGDGGSGSGNSGGGAGHAGPHFPDEWPRGPVSADAVRASACALLTSVGALVSKRSRPAGGASKSFVVVRAGFAVDDEEGVSLLWLDEASKEDDDVIAVVCSLALGIDSDLGPMPLFTVV